jgi:acetylornithine/succinyldiaminopimelate/putrescine aminotransferase/predicted amino acid dehydrogenase
MTESMVASTIAGPGALAGGGLDAHDAEASSRPADAPLRELYARYSRPQLMAVLSAIGLDVIYERGQGDYLYYRDDRGHEVAVLDLLGGFGASLFGHNHPRLVSCATRSLRELRPFNAQASVRSASALLAYRLSQRIGAATGRDYVTTFASTGAEVVEAAIKHAELERRLGGDRLLQRLRHENVRARRAVATGEARWEAASFERALGVSALGPDASPREVAQALLSIAERELGKPGTVLALERAFHGKTTGALRLTHNPEYRAPWRCFGHALFIPAGDVAALQRAVQAATVVLPLVTLGDDGLVRLQDMPRVDVVALFVEPIQGEGGIHELSLDYWQAIRAVADSAGFPVVVDEIQTGMGRTGRFLASEALGARGDYYLLSKSLGGGLAKIAALSVDSERYQPDFGYLHTSTFADDDPSSLIALAALDLLEERDGALLRACSNKGEYLLGKLRALQEAFPDVIRAVRGRGLMVGIELALSAPASAFLRLLCAQNLLGFMVAGYLLHEWKIRLAPALSANGTLRLEPSAGVELAELDRYCLALETVARLLRDEDTLTLTSFLFPEEARKERPRPARARRPASWPAASAGKRRAAFLAHFSVATDLQHFDPAFATLGESTCRQVLDKLSTTLTPFHLDSFQIASMDGGRVDLAVIALPFTSAQVATALREGRAEWALDHVRAGVELAKELGCDVIGFGGYSSIVSDNCRAIADDELVLTSGNSLTVAAAIDTMFAAADAHGIGTRRLGVVGATGNIGAMMAELAASEVSHTTLVGRPGAARRLEALAARLPGSVSVATDLNALRECNVIIGASNAPAPIIAAQHLSHENVVICDVAVPRDVALEVELERPNCRVLKGGSVRLPLEQRLDNRGLMIDGDAVYACLAETLVVALAGIERNFSFGALRGADVREVRRLALQHGFSFEGAARRQ